MADRQEVLNHVRQALASEPRIGAHRHTIAVAFDDGCLTMEGEVTSVAVKKLALERAAALVEVTGIIDRLRVAPAQPMGDKEIRDHVRNALVGEPAFSNLVIRATQNGELQSAMEPDSAVGVIDIEVEDGVVTLDGEVPSLVRKRLAGVLAWRVPGSRDVINGLGVEPPEDDSDDTIADAVEIVLEKDPFVDAGQIRIGVRGAVVTLTGLVPADSEREMAEFDAWYVFGVDRVVNRIEVRP